MGTVKYSGPVASFHCPTEATIRSLKVHFSPKQLGEGTPSPENIRPIEGWNEINLYNTGRNLLDTSKKYQALSTQVTIGQDIGRNNFKTFLKAGTYTITTSTSISASVFIGRKSLGNTSTRIGDTNKSNTFTIDSDDWCEFFIYKGNTGITVNDIISFQLEYNSTATSYESYHGSTTNYEFGVLGKNKVPFLVDSKTISSQINGNAGWCNVWKIPNKNLKYTYSAYIDNTNNTNTANITVWLKNIDNTSYVDGTAKSGTQVAAGAVGRSTITLDASTLSNTYYFVFGITSFIKSGETASCTFSNPMVEIGDTATAYEPYDPNKTVYGGWVDLITGEVSEEWRLITGNNLTSITAPTSTSSPWNHIFTIGLWNKITGTWDKAKGASNIISDVAITGNSNTNQSVFGVSNSAGMYLRDDSISTREEFLEKYGDKHIAYKIATPITYSLAPLEMQTFLSQNNIWSNADYVEVEYDLHETQTILARKQFIIANQPHVVKPAAAPLQNFITDMAAPLKGCRVHFKPVQDLHGYDKPWVGGSGKNLFNINATEQDPDNTTLSNSSVRKFTTGTYSKGASYSNYWQASQIFECTINNNAITVSATTGYGVGFPIKMKEGTTYFISCTMTGNSSGQINIAPYDMEGNYLGDAVLVNYVNRTYTAPANIDIGVVIFRNQTSKDNPISTTFSSIQVEVGTAATSYAPYENICPISGWTEMEVTRCGKNFSTAATGTEMAQKWPIPSGASSRQLQFFSFPPGQEFTLSASFTKASEPSSNKRLYLNGSQVANSTTNSIFDGPRADGPHNSIIHNWVNENGELWISHNNRGLTYNDDFIEYAASLQNIQLELGDTATAFESYNGTTIPITFPSEAGTIYGGYVDLVTGEVWETWHLYRLPKLTSSNCTMGSQSYIKSDATDVFVYPAAAYRQYPSVGAQSVDYSPVCNRLTFANKGIWGMAGYPNCWTLNGGQVHINISNDLLGITNYTEETTTTAKAKVIEYMNAQYDAGNYFDFAYKIAPILITTLTPTTLKTLRGTNNIWSNSNGDITVQFWRH